MTKTYVKNYTNTFIIHGHEYEVTAPARFDSETDELVDDMELDDQAVELANDQYRAEMKLVTPEEIKKYRAKVGLSQREFANLFGWSPNTVALYETGAFPSEANNRILKALMRDDHFLFGTVEDRKEMLPTSVLNKVDQYLRHDSSKVFIPKHQNHNLMLSS